MSGLSRVNQQRAADRATRSATGTPVGGGGPGSGFGPGAGFGAGAGVGGPGSGMGAGMGGGPGAGLGPGAGFARPASSASGPIYGGSGRASPFGRPASTASQYSESPFGGGMSSHAGPSFGAYGGAMEHQLEQHNDDLLGGLLGKVNTLKDLTVNIGKEVRDGNLELSGMNDTFGSTGNMLSGTFRRMTRMANRQGSNWCWFMGFLLIVFWIIIILWFFRR